MIEISRRTLGPVLVGLAVLLTAAGFETAPVTAQSPRATGESYVLNDSHLHLTNYIQEGTDIHDFLKVMGTKVGRVAIFGLPLQQMWA
jgi:hypothetical protein